jgi:hypothetical protein
VLTTKKSDLFEHGKRHLRVPPPRHLHARSAYGVYNEATSEASMGKLNVQMDKKSKRRFRSIGCLPQLPRPRGRLSAKRSGWIPYGISVANSTNQLISRGR